MHKTSMSRRNMLGALLATAGGTISPFALNLAAMGSAAAASASDYKALVCLFMTGGNDHYNTLLATDPDSWSEYQRMRNTGDAISIALRQSGSTGGVLPLTPSTPHLGRSFALHPELDQLKVLFDWGRLAAVANVGPLVVPTTRAQFLAQSVPLPSKLFSHNDQQTNWHASMPEGAQVGWGGRLADMVAAGNANASFTCISAAGNSVFLNGRKIRQYQISSAGAVPIQGLGGRVFAGNVPLRNIVAGDQSNLLQKAHSDIVNRSIDLQAVLGNALVPAGLDGVPGPTRYTNPNTGASLVNPLAVQLQTVARMIATRNTLGIKRQVFFVNLGTFDTHDNQTSRHADLLARLSHAMFYFDTQMGSLMGANMRDKVTLFTASDFGRTLTSNGDGTDHGWGSHHFVMGGAVKGKNIYGDFPVIGLKHTLDSGQGALIPSLSVEQYAGTLASWFGLPDSQLLDVFPNLANFSKRDLGFMA